MIDYSIIRPITRRYWGSGSSKSPGITQVVPEPPPPAAPVRKYPGEKAEKEDLLARLKKARSRALSRVADVAMLEEPPMTSRPVLSNILG